MILLGGEGSGRGRGRSGRWVLEGKAQEVMPSGGGRAQRGSGRGRSRWGRWVL